MGPGGFSLGPLNLFFCAINTVDSSISSLQSLVANKQDKLTFDTTPTSGSSNPITSGGVYTAINESASKPGIPLYVGLNLGIVYMKSISAYGSSGVGSKITGPFIKCRLSNRAEPSYELNGAYYIKSGAYNTTTLSLQLTETLDTISESYGVHESYFKTILDPLVGVESTMSMTSIFPSRARCAIYCGSNPSDGQPMGECNVEMIGKKCYIKDYTLYTNDRGYIPVSSNLGGSFSNYIFAIAIYSCELI